ncbi:uncharacterized protein BJ212DRAFT_1316623 [Suillus subaureus]|uniref:BRCT domain-containing protein n=1 Tax=Suillus subaureus TaxID=48587 RepID=A0A9P7EMQ0_9AGAM|nr:uncharacterized protein BJ212DRAFT_1316623 [Suillus subaureus]KAG1825873.1 hypothetical protein BJ212DRAFT_1316623 [Suillus subaureus]
MELSSEPFMDTLFASQSTSENEKILVHPDGRGYNIHLQVNGISLRPNLVRMMKKGGAYASRPEDADIILVDSSQLDGKRLIRTWHQTPGKAVLEFQWLRKSIEARKPLLEIDGWGGTQTLDDGRPIVEVAADGEEAEVEQLVSKSVSRPEVLQGDSLLMSSIRSPLPTPRVTPEEPLTKRILNNVPTTLAADVPLIPNNPRPPQSPQQASLVVSQNLQQPSEHAGQPTYNHTPSISPPVQSSNTPQPIAPPQQLISVLPYNPQALPQPQLAQPATPASFSHIQFSQTPSQTQPTQPATPVPFLHPQFSQVSQFQPQFSQAPPFPQQFPVPQQSYQFGQFPQQQLISGHMPFMPPQSMTMPTGMPFHNLRDPQSFQMLMTLMDVMRNTNGGEFLQAGQPSPMYPQIEAASSAPPVIHHEQTPDSLVATDQPYPPSSSSYKSRSPTPDVVVSKHPEKQSRPSGRKPRTDISSRTPSTVLLPPSVKRKANHEAMSLVGNPSNNRSLKGKERVVISDESDNDEDAPPAGSDDVFEQSLLSSPGRTNARKNSGEVFLDDQGQPLTFFVQVDLQGRSGVVSNIKKNKGKVIGSIADADYVILFTRSQTFQGLLSEAHACDKVPIQSVFVANCVAENTLLDESEYALDTGVSVKHAKRGRPNSAFFEFVQETSSVKKECQKSVSKPKPKAQKATPTETPTKKAKKRSASTSSQISAALLPPSSKEAKSHHARRSPTPPPPETRKSMRDGKFHFTQPEIEYFCQYAQFLLNEDPTMSTTALLQAMHKKMPHHSFGSWQMQASSKLKTQLTDIRKRANIAFRKSSNGNTEKSTEERPGPSKKPRLAALPAAPIVSQETLEREDFEIICEFFANGGGDDDNDERVWERLSQYRPCKSAESWPEYYTTHQSEVYARIEELVRSSS